MSHSRILCLERDRVEQIDVEEGLRDLSVVQATVT